MNYSDAAATFECEGERLFGVVSVPERAKSLGVVIVVGGPQYRAGSHRQFVSLARRLAAAGYAVLRFDCRGMGDSTGSMRSFEDVTPDIDAAIGALRAACPAVTRIALWGLCDGASAMLLWCAERHDARVAGMALLNPWVRSESTRAKTQLKHYYGRRLFSKGLWLKLAHGDVDVAGALRALASHARAIGTTRPRSASSPSFQDRMLEGLRAFEGPVLVLLSGKDLTAREFSELARGQAQWRDRLGRRDVDERAFADADHTFSSARWREAMESATLAWLRDRVLSRP
jgi:exosortase A-associated hydrolase 1